MQEKTPVAEQEGERQARHVLGTLHDVLEAYDISQETASNDIELYGVAQSIVEYVRSSFDKVVRERDEAREALRKIQSPGVYFSGIDSPEAHVECVTQMASAALKENPDDTR